MPEEGDILGYAAIINILELEVPIPNVISLISTKNRKYKTDVDRAAIYKFGCTTNFRIQKK